MTAYVALLRAVNVGGTNRVPIAAVYDRNPFIATGRELDPATLHIAFLSERPSFAAVTTLDPDRSPPDAFVVDDREVYLAEG